MKKKLSLILVIIWMIIIFLFSNQNANESSKMSSGLIEKTIITLYEKSDNYNEEMKTQIVEDYSFYVRKAAHFTEYLILGLLILNYLSYFNYQKKKTILLSLIICIIYAISDEVHQLFIDGRSAQFFDVLVDSVGSSCGSLLMSVFKRHKK